VVEEVIVITPSSQDAKVEKAVAFPIRKPHFNALLTEKATLLGSRLA